MKIINILKYLFEVKTNNNSIQINQFNDLNQLQKKIYLMLMYQIHHAGVVRIPYTEFLDDENLNILNNSSLIKNNYSIDELDEEKLNYYLKTNQQKISKLFNEFYQYHQDNFSNKVKPINNTYYQNINSFSFASLKIIKFGSKDDEKLPFEQKTKRPF